MKRRKHRKKRYYKERRRKQDLKESRYQTRDKIVPWANLSSDGIAVIKGDKRRAYWKTYRCNKHGLVQYSQKLGKDYTKPWNNLSRAEIDVLNRFEWEPNKEKHALELLAECAS